MFYNPADPQTGKDASFSGDYPFGGKVMMFKRTNKDGSPIPDGHPTWRLVWVDPYAEASDSEYGGGQQQQVIDHDQDPFG